MTIVVGVEPDRIGWDRFDIDARTPHRYTGFRVDAHTVNSRRPSVM